MDKLRYQVWPRFPETHLLLVTVTIPNPNREGQMIMLPNWIPGSYLIRDFSRHLLDMQAERGGQAIGIHMLNKNTWQCDPLPDNFHPESNLLSQDASDSPNASLIITYQIYAWDLTPRGAHVNNQHAFFNGARVFVQVMGYEESPCEIEFLKPADEKYKHWRLATSLSSKTVLDANNINSSNVSANNDTPSFGIYIAKNYEDLIDQPVEMGNFETHQFYARNVLHELVITHTASKDQQRLDITRLCQDLQKIAEHHIDFFGEPAAKEKFIFLLTLFMEGRGGIEHNDACVVHACYEDMPKLVSAGKSDTHLARQPDQRYRNLLVLLSHEYFHAWHVKRIKPQAFMPYDLNRENYSRLLWLFEGITSYYDELSLVRADIISVDAYLEALSQIINVIYVNPGRKWQTLEASSFEAWTKFYQPNENSNNATVSYYAKGALFGLCLDLFLRKETAGKVSLDTIMQALWLQYGKKGKGLEENGFEVLAAEISGLDLSQFFNLGLRSQEELPLETLLETVGVGIRWQMANVLENLGVRLNPRNKETIELMEVISDSAFEKAGFSARDQIIAVNAHKVDPGNLELRLSTYAEGDGVEIHGFRHDELFTAALSIHYRNAKMASLYRISDSSAQQNQALSAWLQPKSKDQTDAVIPNQESGFSKEAGFSLVEVLLTLLLWAVISCGTGKLLIQAKLFEHKAKLQEQQLLQLVEKTENLSPL